MPSLLCQKNRHIHQHTPTDRPNRPTNRSTKQSTRWVGQTTQSAQTTETSRALMTFCFSCVLAQAARKKYGRDRRAESEAFRHNSSKPPGPERIIVARAQDHYIPKKKSNSTVCGTGFPCKLISTPLPLPPPLSQPSRPHPWTPTLDSTKKDLAYFLTQDTLRCVCAACLKTQNRHEY